MIQTEPIGLMNTGLPVALLIALAWILPRMLTGRTRSQLRLALAILASALAVLLAGGVIFAVTYMLRGADVTAPLTEAPMTTGLFFLRLSALAALAWGPILVLNWLVMATALETRRGQDIVRADMGKPNGSAT